MSGGARIVRPMRTLTSLASAALIAAVGGLVVSQAAGQVAIGPPLGAAPITTESCEAGVLPQLRGTIPVPSTCTLIGTSTTGAWTTQVPRGSWRVTSVNVRTGARTGPMRVQVIRNMRSQATGVGGGPGGAICCTSPAQSQVFTLPPNAVGTVPVDIPVTNTVELVDREPVEVVDYLGLTILDRGSSLPVAADPGAMLTMFLPALDRGGQDLMGPSFQGMFPLLSAVVCPRTTSNERDRSGKISLQRTGCTTVPGAGRVSVRSTVPRQTVAQLRRSGAIRTTCRADVRAACTARATVGAAAARAMGLRVPRGARTVTLGTRRATVPAGRVRTLSVPLTRVARAALGRARTPVRITITTTASASGRTAGKATRTLVARV